MAHLANIDPLIALGVIAATALTDAVCVLFTSSVMHRKDLAAANWSSLSYTALSAFAVISFTNNWIYIVFAALGSWIGAYATMKYLRWQSARNTQREGAAPAVANAVVDLSSDLVAAWSRRPCPPRLPLRPAPRRVINRGRSGRQSHGQPRQGRIDDGAEGGGKRDQGVGDELAERDRHTHPRLDAVRAGRPRARSRPPAR